MKILAIDIGRASGWCYQDETEMHSGHFKFESLYAYKMKVIEFLKDFKPDILITCKPNRFYNTIYVHGKLAGILELCAETENVQYMEFTDPEVKKVTMGKGVVKKEQVIEQYGGETFDEADARMMADFGLKTLEIL